MQLRHELQRVVDDLLAGSVPGQLVSLDDLGDAIGVRSVSGEEIEAIIVALERAGRTVGGGTWVNPKEDLAPVIAAANELRGEGKPPTVKAIASRTALSEERVRAALRLGQIMGR